MTSSAAAYDLNYLEEKTSYQKPNFHYCKKLDAKAKAKANTKTFVFLAILLSVILLTVSFTVSYLRESKTAEILAATNTIEVQVKPGESLWELAEAHQVKGVSTREVVSWMADVNGLEGGQLEAGQWLRVAA